MASEAPGLPDDHVLLLPSQNMGGSRTTTPGTTTP